MCVSVCLSACSVTESCDILVNPWTAACQASLSTGFHRIAERILEWAVISSSKGSSQPRGSKPPSPALAVRFLTTELPGKPIQILYLYGIHGTTNSDLN